MLTNTERQQIVEEVNAGTYGIDEALDDIAAAQKGEEVRKALYAEALVLNREGHAGSTDLIARQQIANLQTSVNGQISTLRTEVGDDIDDLETALNNGLATQNGKIAAQDATIANVVANYNVEYGSTELWASTGETGALAAGTTVTLSEDVSHFDYIDIYSFCGNSNVLDTVPVDAKLQSNAGYALRWVNLSDPGTGTYQAYVRIVETKIKIIGTTLTIVHQVTYRNGESVSVSGAEITQSNRSTYVGELGIMKIVGRKITANTEVEDIRTGADGTTYNSAGAAVRAQVQALDDAIPAVDDTLSVQGAAADAAAVGAALENVTVDVDATLTQSGQAADAKAVGDALAEKADADDVSAINESVTEINDSLTEYDSILYTEDGGESGQISGQIIQFNSADGLPESIGVDGNGVTSGNLTVCGVNLFPKYPAGSASGLTWTVDSDGVISFTGTPTADVMIRMRDIFLPLENVLASFAMFNNMTNARLSFFCATPSNTGNYQLNMTAVNVSNSTTFTTDLVELRIRVPKDVDWTGLTIKPMLVYGGTAPSAFIPYDGQTYSVTLGTDGKVNESISYKSGINTIFSNFGAVTAYMPAADRRTIKEDLVALSEVVNMGDSFYKYEVSGSARYLHIYYKSGKNWVKWQLHNVPAPNSNSDTWQIGRICGLDENLENLTELVRGGEFELAIREHGASDYCGGNNHGDETTDVFKLFIDGKQIADLSTLPTTYTPFTRIDAFEIATVNRCDTPTEDIVKHQKVWIFEGGKVKVRQTLKFLETLSIDVAMVCMCAALRSAFPYGIRKGGVAIEDMTTATYTKVHTTADDVFYEYYGEKATCKVHAKTDNPNNTSVMWINNTSDLNKLYYGYFGITNSANPTTVPVNTVITAESDHEVAYTA